MKLDIKHLFGKYMFFGEGGCKSCMLVFLVHEKKIKRITINKHQKNNNHHVRSASVTRGAFSQTGGIFSPISSDCAVGVVPTL